MEKEKKKMRKMRKQTKFDAQGLNKGRGREYGVIIWPIEPSSEYGAAPNKLNITNKMDSIAVNKKAPLPYYSYPVSRWEFYVSGTLSGNREYLRKTIDKEGVHMEARNTALRLLYDAHPTPTWVSQPAVGLLIRFDFWYLGHYHLYNKEDEDVDEYVYEEEGEGEGELEWEVEEDHIELSPASEYAVWDLERGGIRADCREKGCAICYEDYTQDSEGIELPCSHVFHGDCIISWLARSTVNLSVPCAVSSSRLFKRVKILYDQLLARSPTFLFSNRSIDMYNCFVLLFKSFIL